MIPDGASIMIGGFLATGAPKQIVDALAESGVKNLTIICNDTVFVVVDNIVDVVE